MTSKKTNSEALRALAEQQWGKVQMLLFANARYFPSHQTYNNLGFYLITEGLLCKNGKVRNALELGMKYLLKAEKIKFSSINANAIAKAIDLQLRKKHNNKETLCREALNHLKNAIAVNFSNELRYNFLRFSYLLNPKDASLIHQAKELQASFSSQETVSLYFEILRQNARISEGTDLISNYGHWIDDTDKLMFYAKCKLYEQGYELCDSIYKQYSMDEFLISAIIECCLNTGHSAEADMYISKLQYDGELFDVHIESSLERKNIIEKFISNQPLFDSCCYFGCHFHKTPWDSL